MIGRIGPYELNQIYCGECSELMTGIPNNSIPMWITSPPYDGLRIYKGYTFPFEAIARQLYRITQPGGVGVWVVGDETKDGSESGTSFRQALYFMGLGFNLHDTMIYQTDKPPLTHNRYEQHFEYMFVFSKGGPGAFNPILEQKIWTDNRKVKAFRRERDGAMDLGFASKTQTKIKSNIWYYKTGGGHTSTDDIAQSHPAIFPEALARDHILSWSNPGDLVLDPMAGSGTTLKMAYLTGRLGLGFEISEEYCQIARRRLEATMSQPKLFNPYQVETVQPQQMALEVDR